MPPGDVYTFNVHIIGACDLDTNITLQVDAQDAPNAFFRLSDYSGCAPFTPDIINESDSSYIYRWDYTNDGSWDEDTYDFTVAPSTFTYDNTSSTDSTYTIRMLTRYDGSVCTNEHTVDVHVKPEIHADFIPDTLIGCNPLEVHFADSSYGNIDPDRYVWDFNDGNTTNGPGDKIHTFSHINTSDTVEYDVELRLTSPYLCKDTAHTTIRVFPHIEADFTIDNNNGCSPLTVTFTNASAGDVTDTLFYGDGATPYTGAFFGSLPHEYVNTGDTVAHFPVELRVYNHAGCKRIHRDTITVYPEVQAAFDLDTGRVCNADTIEFTRTSPHGEHIASDFYWTFGNGSNMNTDSTVITFNKFYANTTDSDQTYTVRLVAQSQYGCADTVYRDVLAYRAQADFVLDENDGCSPLEVNITNQSKGTGIDYLWEFDNGNPTSNDEDPTNPISYNNTSDAVTEHYLSLTVSSTDGFCSTDQTVTITVYPEVHITDIVPSASEVCDSTQVDFEADISDTLLPNVSYTWDFDDGASANTNPATNLFRNINQTGAVVRNVQLDVETKYGCLDSSSVNVTVHPRVRAFFTMDASSGCSPDTITVTPMYYPGISEYSWDFGDGSPVLNTPNADPQTNVFPRNTSTTNANDMYDVTLTVSNGNATCTKTFSRTDTVFAEAKADFGPMDTIGCNPFKFSFRDYSINANQYTWDFKDGTTSSVTEPAHQFENTTPTTRPFDVNLKVTTTNGCTHDTTGLIKVYPYTNADFDIDLSEDCSPLTVNISNNSSGTEYYWFWDNDDLDLGNPDSTITSSFSKTYYNTSGTSRTDSLTLIVGNGHGCYDTLKRGITIHSSILADFSYVQNNACNPSDVVFTNTSSGGGSYTMNWNFGDGSSLTTLSSPVNKTFTNNTTDNKTFEVVMTAESENGCTDSHTDYITVYSKVIADYSIEENEGCPPFTTTIQNASVGNAANTYTWYVDGADEFSSTGLADFDYTYENTTTSLRPYQVRLVAENEHGCSSEYIDTVTVYEFVRALYDMDTDNGCTPLDIEFTDLSSVPPATKYTWSFGDGATSGSANPSHTFYNSSRTDDRTFTVDLTVQSPNFCTDDTSAVVTVYHQPLSKFFIDNTSSCPPLVSYMENESVGEDMFEWRFGDGTNNTTDQTLTHTYPNTLVDVVQNYTLELWVGTNEGCKDSTSLELSVFPDVIADFTYDEAGCSPFVSSFINESTSPAQYFYWNFDDGNTSNQENPVHRFTNTWNTNRTYNVFLRASSEYNCWDTITKPVTAYVQPIVEFDVNPLVQKFPENRVFIDNKTNDGPFNYLWEYGDLEENTSTDVEPNYFDYEHWGEKDITLTVTSQTSDCNDALTKTVTILPPDINADFTTSVDVGCLNDGLDVDFIAAASIYSEVYEYIWDFGDGEIGEGAEITHTYTEPGTYNVKLTATGEGGEDYEYKKIRVYSNPVAKFELLPSITMLDAETLEARVEFYNQSMCNDTSGCSYLWDFGDGKTSIATNVTHYYEKPPDDEMPKEYDVKLVVINSQGCVDSLIKERAVKVIGEGEIAFPNAFTPNEDGINDVFKPVAKGVVEYELLIYNRWGELIFETNNLEMGWNGKVGGKEAKSDVYVWKAEGRFTNGRAFELAGDVTLIR
ncbi:MAG: PKD domain-containing protein [Bacteroidota bacterium]|nr:PKD domain-containing protein [Bacteroidota bacterium]